MTTRLTVKNEGPSSIRVGTRDRGLATDGDAAPVFIETSAKTLAPGESGELWVHDGRNLLIEEVKT